MLNAPRPGQDFSGYPLKGDQPFGPAPLKGDFGHPEKPHWKRLDP